MRQNSIFAAAGVVFAFSVVSAAYAEIATPPTPAVPAQPPSATSFTISPQVEPRTNEDMFDENDHRDQLKELLFDMHKKEAWLTLSEDERKQVLSEVLPSMTFNALKDEKLEEATGKVDACVASELQKDEYEHYDVATAITACLFKMGYAQ